MAKAGAKSTYQQNYPERAERYCARFGFVDKDLAEEFGVTERTINDWKKKYPKFRRAIEKGKKLSGEFIELNLRQLAMPHDEVQEEVALTGKGKAAKMKVVGKKVKKNVVNVGAARMVLAADFPDRYGNKLTVGGDADNPLVVADPDKVAELKQLAKQISEKRLNERNKKK